MSLLRQPDFRALLAGTALSSAGARLMGLALPLLVVTREHAGVGRVAVLSALGSAAFVVVGLPAGAIVDRVRRRRLIVVADAGRAALAALLGADIGYAGLCVVAVATGVLTVFADVAGQSILPQLVGDGDLVEGNSRLTTVATVAGVLGPTAAGALVAASGARGAALVIAAGFAGSAIAVGRIRAADPLPVPAPRRELWKEVRAGVDLVRGEPVLRLIALSGATYNLFFLVVQSVLLVRIVDGLGVSATGAGVYYSAGGVGGVVGALVAGRVTARVGRHRVIGTAFVVTTPFMLLTPLATDRSGLWLAAGGFAVAYAGLAVGNIAQVSVRQELCPGVLLGRVSATMRVLIWSALPAGALLGGAIATVAGTRAALWVGAVGMIVACVPVCLPALRQRDRLPVALAAA